MCGVLQEGTISIFDVSFSEQHIICNTVPFLIKTNECHSFMSYLMENTIILFLNSRYCRIKGMSYAKFKPSQHINKHGYIPKWRYHFQNYNEIKRILKKWHIIHV